MRLLVRDSLSRDEKTKKEPLVVYQRSEIYVAGVSSDLPKSSRLKVEFVFCSIKPLSPRNAPLYSYLSKSTLNFTQTQKVSLSAHERKLHQNTLNILQNIIETR